MKNISKKMEIREIMLDLETLGTRNNAVILAIGAMKFNRKDPQLQFENVSEKDKFFRRIIPASCLEIGMCIEQETVNWWKKQDPQVQKEIFEGKKIPLKEALQEFKTWFADSQKIWSHGCNFDIAILEEAYKKCSIEIPWKYWDTRDTRTVYDIGNVNMNNIPKPNHHHPVYDCFRQIQGIKQGLKSLERKTG
jgi:exodeoxyribonuclease VIII